MPKGTPAPAQFSVDTIGDLDDGTVRLLIDTALDEALTDCDARPMLPKARRVTITVELQPVINDRGGMKGVEASIKVSTKVPPRQGRGEYLPTTAKGDGVIATLPTDTAVRMFTEGTPS
jgi:hypothetical protein